MSVELPLVSFGVLTDAQYADCDNKPLWSNPNVTRHYRDALKHIDHAFEQWMKSNVAFCLQLGDVIDCLNRESSNSDMALEKVLERFEMQQSIPTFHAVGNHELYNFTHDILALHFRNYYSKMKLLPHMFMPSEESNTRTLYYSFRPVTGVKCVALDCFDVSVNGYAKDHSKYLEAASVLSTYHNHEDFDTWDCNCSDLLDVSITEQRFAPWNGGVGAEQLRWLQRELSESDFENEMVIVFGHVCLLPESTTWDSLVWNYEKVLSIFHEHHCVSAYFCGHSHRNSYARGSTGIHYVVFPAIIETPPDEEAFATVLLYRNQLEIRGYGQVISRTLRLNQCPGEPADCFSSVPKENPASGDKFRFDSDLAPLRSYQIDERKYAK